MKDTIYIKNIFRNESEEALKKAVTEKMERLINSYIAAQTQTFPNV